MDLPAHRHSHPCAQSLGMGCARGNQENVQSEDVRVGECWPCFYGSEQRPRSAASGVKALDSKYATKGIFEKWMSPYS